MLRIKSILTLCLLGILAFGVFSGCGRNNNPQKTWLIYEGEIENYKVEISEATYEDGETSRIIHLYAKTEKGRDVFDSISAHSNTHTYAGTNDWHHLFRCGYPEESNGCNAVAFNGPGEMSWEPCHMDKDSVQPFTFLEVDEWMSLVATAMRTVYNDAHLTTPKTERWWYNRDNPIAHN